jgi:NTP pyrophosphatase (non-canonical NTP hydrolase)
MCLYIIYYERGDGEPDGSVMVFSDNEEDALRRFREEYPGEVATGVMEFSESGASGHCLTEDQPWPDPRKSYRDAIVELIDQQRAKGLKKYGETLEDNVTLNNEQRIEHAQEELIDALQYLEHLKQTQRDKLTVADYERSALRTVNTENADKFQGYGNLLDGVLGLTGEAGEVADVVKKALFQGHELDEEHMAEELGDVAWYLVLCCHSIGLTLEGVLQGNIDKLRRRYPEGFDKARSINREEVAEA